MSEELDDEGKLVSMILEANKDVRYATICDNGGKMLWHSRRNDIENIMNIEDTRASLKRAVENWKERDKLSPKIGRGKFTVTEYEKLTRVSVPLTRGHLLYIHVNPGKNPYMGDILKIVDWVEKHPSS